MMNKELENSILMMQGVFEDKDFPIDKDFTIWEYRKEIKDLLDHALNNHCIDCCCQKSWEALGKKDYTGKSIPEEIEKLVLESNANYIRGLKAGVRLYAWWKDGIQYVGTCGTTLKHALERIDEE
jgi:hypothetical protein